MENQQSNDYYSGNKISVLIIYALSYAAGIMMYLFFDDYFYESNNLPIFFITLFISKISFTPPDYYTR